MPKYSKCPRIGGLSSTNPLVVSVDPLVGFASNVIEGECPLLTFDSHGKEFKGMIDIGANVSIISFQYWTHNWTFLQKIP